MKAEVAAFNQEKALVGAFSVITNLRMELFQALAQAPDGEEEEAGDEAAEAGADLREGLLQQLPDCR